MSLPAAPPPSPPPKLYPKYKSLGCYVDTNDSRHMPVRLIWNEDWTVSIDSCYRAAAAKGIKYFGVQAGKQCVGSYDLAYTKSLGLSKNCNMPCTANTTQICGGANANSVYSVLVF